MTETEIAIKDLSLQIIGELYLSHVVAQRNISDLQRLLAATAKTSSEVNDGDPPAPAPQA